MCRGAPLAAVLLLSTLAVQEAAARSYVGCFSNNDELLPSTEMVSTSSISLNECELHCTTVAVGAPYTVMGLGGRATAYHCTCGFAYGRNPQDDSKCTTRCPAPSTDKCGEFLDIAVYSLADKAATFTNVAEYYTGNSVGDDKDLSVCTAPWVDNRCNCPNSNAMTALYRNDSQQLSSFSHFRCAGPVDQVVDFHLNCQMLPVSWGEHEWFECPSGQVLRGFKSAISTCDSLSCITEMRCCAPELNKAVMTRSDVFYMDMRDCMSSGNTGYCDVPKNAYIVGLFRPDCDTIDCVSYVKYAYYDADSVPAPVPPTRPPPTQAPDTSSPPTPSPPTPAPATPAPVTPAPATRPPQTPAPATSAPDTNAPPTAAPDTKPPATPAPPTPAPPTPAPPTQAPPTPAPETPAPLTPAPPTPAPATAAPPTPAPDTKSPPTDAPQTLAPDTLSPPTSVPSTEAPPTPAPETLAPPTEAPSTAAPDTRPPATAAPQTGVPKTAAPPTASPETLSPPTQAPDTLSPPTFPPATLAPPTDVPSTVSPDTNPPATFAPLTLSPETPSPPTPVPETLAPQTIVPATVAPPTDAPKTQAPPTSVPDTLAPPTIAPATLAPPTDAPKTNVPMTLAPVVPTSVPTEAPTRTPAAATDAPATSAPITKQPTVLTQMPLPTPSTHTSAPTYVPTPAPPTLQPVETPAPRYRDTATSGLGAEQKENLQLSTTVASSAAVAGGAAGNAGKLTVLNSFGCEMDDVDVGDEKLDWEFHPLVFPMGTSRGKYKVAAMVMNPLLVICVGLIALAVSGATQMTLGYKTERSLGLARFPGVLYVPYLFLLQGTSLVSTQVVFDASRHSGGVVVFAAVVLAACLASPAALYFFVLRKVTLNAELFPDPAIYGNPGTDEKGPRANSLLYKFAFGRDIWVSRDSYFSERYGICFENLRPGCLWYIVAELLCVLLLSLLSGWKPTTKTACSTRNFSIAAMLTAFFLAAAIKRPFIAPMDNFVAIVMSCAMALAVIGMSIAIHAEMPKESHLYSVCLMFLLAAALLIMLKCIWDFVLYAMDVCIARRSGARDLAREMHYRAHDYEEEELVQRSEQSNSPLLLFSPVYPPHETPALQPSSALCLLDDLEERGLGLPPAVLDGYSGYAGGASTWGTTATGREGAHTAPGATPTANTSGAASPLCEEDLDELAYLGSFNSHTFSFSGSAKRGRLILRV